MQTRIEDFGAALQSRLKKVAGDTSLSEIARRTDTPFASVHRYFNGSKVPSEFLAGFARAFEVNPSWLLHGEGTPMLSDVSAENAKLGGDLLELVEAMNAVSRMRLGALTGKHHLRVLRELSDAMERFEALRARLDGQTKPIFRQLMQDFDKLLRRRDLVRAGEMRKALDQVARLSANERLLQHYDYLQGLQAHIEGDFGTAIDFHRRSFMRELARQAEFTRTAAERGGNFIVALRDHGRIAEAHRMVNAIIQLMQGRDDLDDAIAWMEAFAGAIEVDLLKVGDAMTRVCRSLPVSVYDLRREGAGVWIRPSLWACSVTFEEALEWGNNFPRKVRFLARYANWREEPEWIETLLNEHVADQRMKLHSTDPDARHAARLLAALKGERDPEIQLAPARSPFADFRDTVLENQLALVCDDTAAARKHLLQADKLLKELPGDITPPLEYHATHFRNALRINSKARGIPALQKRARAFFEALLKNGCLEARFVLEPEAPRPELPGAFHSGQQVEL